MRFYQIAFAILTALLVWTLFAYNYDAEVYTVTDCPIETPLEDTAHYMTKDGEIIHAYH